MIAAVAALVTSAAGDEGASQRMVQRTLLSHGALNHFQVSLATFGPPGMF